MAKKTTHQGDVWVIKKDDFQNALDILEHAITQPLAPKKKNPTDVNLLARSVVEAAIGESIIPKKRKQKKK